MPPSPNTSGLKLLSTITQDANLRLSLAHVNTPTPTPDQVIVRVEAAPINPSDLGLLLGPADLSTLAVTGTGAETTVTARIPAAAMPAMASRLGQAMPVGNEGAGIVVAAGSSDAAQALLGKTVAMLGGAMYAQYRCIAAADCLLLPDGATPADGASCFVNPLTSLGMVETMRREGHTALVHTAAASNLGQMLNRICLKDGVALVNIVRSPAQADLLRTIGAQHVVDSTAPGFLPDLTAALSATGATLAFDAIGGGTLAGQILSCMEQAIAAKSAGTYTRYGSNTHKQVYIYGTLDSRPVEITRDFGFAWGMGGWLMFPFLQSIGPENVKRLRARVAAELKTTFASHYTAELSLLDVLNPKIIAQYSRRSTGEKVLINPTRPV